jgi:hypothetical protein
MVEELIEMGICTVHTSMVWSFLGGVCRRGVLMWMMRRSHGCGCAMCHSCIYGDSGAAGQDIHGDCCVAYDNGRCVLCLTV